MLELWKDQTLVQRNQVWATECPWCYGYIEFFRTSPLRCPICQGDVEDYTELLRSRTERTKFYIGGQKDARSD